MIPRFRAISQCRRHVSQNGEWRDPASIDFGAVRVNVAERHDVIQGLADEQKKYFLDDANKPAFYKDVDIESPKTIREMLAKWMTEMDITRSRYIHKKYGTRIGITLLNHVNNPDWAMLFGIKEMYLEVTMWLWAIHMWIVQKRLWVVPESAHICKSMHTLFMKTCRSRIAGIYDSHTERGIVEEKMKLIFAGNAIPLDESFRSSCQYRDALMLYALYRNAPFEHREEVPMYAWYTLVQYIRLHLAVFDRIPNNDFKQGYFYFYHPLDRDLFEAPDALDVPTYVPDLLRGKRGAKPPDLSKA